MKNILPDSKQTLTYRITFILTFLFIAFQSPFCQILNPSKPTIAREKPGEFHATDNPYAIQFSISYLFY